MIVMEEVIKEVLTDDLESLSVSIGYAGSTVGMGTTWIGYVNVTIFRLFLQAAAYEPLTSC